MSYYNTHLNYCKTLYNFDNYLSSKSEFWYYYIMCINHLDIQDNFDLCILLFNYYDKYIFFFKVKKDLDHYKMKSKKKEDDYDDNNKITFAFEIITDIIHNIISLGS